MGSHVEKIFAIALELKSDERSVYLDEACANDEAVRREVEGMLAEN